MRALCAVCDELGDTCRGCWGALRRKVQDRYVRRSGGARPEGMARFVLFSLLDHRSTGQRTPALEAWAANEFGDLGPAAVRRGVRALQRWGFLVTSQRGRAATQYLLQVELLSDWADGRLHLVPLSSEIEETTPVVAANRGDKTPLSPDNEVTTRARRNSSSSSPARASSSPPSAAVPAPVVVATSLDSAVETAKTGGVFLEVIVRPELVELLEAGATHEDIVHATGATAHYTTRQGARTAYWFKALRTRLGERIGREHVPGLPEYEAARAARTAEEMNEGEGDRVSRFEDYRRAL